MRCGYGIVMRAHGDFMQYRMRIALFGALQPECYEIYIIY